MWLITRQARDVPCRSLFEIPVLFMLATAALTERCPAGQRVGSGEAGLDSDAESIADTGGRYGKRRICDVDLLTSVPIVVARAPVRSWQLVQPYSDTAIDKIDFTRDYVDVTSRKEGVPDEISHMHELRAHLNTQSTIVVTVRLKIFECFADEAYA